MTRVNIANKEIERQKDQNVSTWAPKSKGKGYTIHRGRRPATIVDKTSLMIVFTPINWSVLSYLFYFNLKKKKY